MLAPKYIHFSSDNLATFLSGRTDNSDLEACILTNQSSEAPSLPSVAEETDKEAKPADDVTKQETGEDAEERKISEISDKLVWDVLQKVKTDLEKEGGQGSKRKLTRNRSKIYQIYFDEKINESFN